ncbi:hypothetical protein EMPS_11276 [Entomortierella parvispora]|uniref:Galactose oxidase n=1 Tax=Entomortierella parvispora TaxID=205924 RepID=A0A9P3HMT9_9FUNG|nr:hypothetical protein EMPS_11276 [Entomortierella parvispora]
MTPSTYPSHRPPQQSFASAALVILLALSLLLPSNVQGQATAPLPVQGPAFARTNTRLYILGGTANNINYGQFFSLDLAANWTTNTPAWSQLSDGPQQNIFPAVFSLDQKTMVTFHSGGTTASYRYSITSGQWTPSNAQAAYAGLQGVGAVTDQNTGLVYLAGGYTDGTRNSMDIYSFSSDSLSQQPMPAATTVFASRSYYANVWCKSRNSILYFGGYNATLQTLLNDNVVTEYVPSTNTFSNMTTSGTAPSMRADLCMTANDDGSLVVLYGGRPANGAPFTGDVYILNTATGAWSQGVAGAPRIYATCTIAGDQLLIWGGIDNNSLLAPASVMIYNLTSSTWLTQYTPPASYIAERAKESPSVPSPGTSPNSGSGDSSSTSSNHAGAIAGGIVGGIALVSAGVLLFIFRGRLHRPSLVNTTGDSDDQDERKMPPPQSAQQQEDEELQRLRLQLQNQQEQLELQRRLLQLQQEQQLQQQQQQQQHLAYQQPHQYQDAGYYQPQTYYSTGTNSGSVAAFNTYDATAGLNAFSTAVPSPPIRPPVGPIHGGYVEGNSSYVESTPVIYHQPPVGASMAVIPVTVPPVSLTAKKADYDNYMEERPPGNPHAIVTP